MNVVYYSTATCVPCKTLKPQAEEICKRKGVKFGDVDIEDPKGHPVPSWLTSVPTMIVHHDDGFDEVLTGQFANPMALRKSLRRND